MEYLAEITVSTANIGTTLRRERIARVSEQIMGLFVLRHQPTAPLLITQDYTQIFSPIDLGANAATKRCLRTRSSTSAFAA